MSEAKMMEQCQDMKEQKAKMKAEMKSYDAQLTEQIAAMNRAPEDKKTALMATIITQMAEPTVSV